MDRADRHRVPDDDIRHALDHLAFRDNDADAEAGIDAVLALGPDRAGLRLELALVVGDDGDVVVGPRHAGEVRASVAPGVREAGTTTDEPTGGPRMASNGTPVTNEMLARLAEKAGAGFDLDRLRPRPPGRPRLGSAPADSLSVRFPPGLRHRATSSTSGPRPSTSARQTSSVAP